MKNPTLSFVRIAALVAALPACVDDPMAPGVTLAPVVVLDTPRWPGGVIHYYVDSDGSAGSRCQPVGTNGPSNGEALSVADTDAIDLAVARYNAFTPLDLQEVADVNDQDTLIFTKGLRDGIPYGGTLGLPDRNDPDGVFYQSTLNPCVFMTGNDANGGVRDTGPSVVLHELGHVIGMVHEQSRFDRDDYVTVDEGCVAFADVNGDGLNDNLTNFYVVDEALAVQAPYDYDSMMHYSSPILLCTDEPCGAGCGDTRWPVTRKCDSDNPYYADGVAGCDPYIEAPRDFSPGDINVIYRRYERSLGTNSDGDDLGATMASGDFDGDGYLDLAVGAPGERHIVGKAGVTVVHTGAVYLWRGTSQRLVAWKRIDLPVLVDNARFGAALAAGDLDGDGADELVVGAPGDVVNGVVDGRVYVYRTTDTTKLGGRLQAVRFGLDSHPWKQFVSTTGGVARSGSQFGAALAVGNFDNRGAADIAIGAPAGAATTVRAGFVIIMRGLSPGETPEKRLLSQVPLSSERGGERFGAALTAAQMADPAITGEALIVGAPDTDVVGLIVSRAGHAYVFTPGVNMTQPSQELNGSALTRGFGSALAYIWGATGPVVAIGAPGEDFSRGRIYVFRRGVQFTGLPLVATPQPLSVGGVVIGQQLGAVLAGVTLGAAPGQFIVAGLPRHGVQSVANAGAYVRFKSVPGDVTHPFAAGVIVDDPNPTSDHHFGSAFGVVGSYDDTTGRFTRNRIAVGATGGAGSFNVRKPTGDWKYFDQTTKHPE